MNEQVLDEKLALLEQRRTWSPRLISKLETLIRTGSDEDLFRINPIQFAHDRGIDEHESIDLFLHATHIGIFEMEWNLMCPSCAHWVENFNQLAHLHTHLLCQACAAEVDVNLDDYILVTFTLVLAIRDNKYRYPNQLSVEDYFFNYYICNEALTQNGQNQADMMRQQTLFMDFLAPRQTTSIECDLIPGILLLIDFTKVPMLNFLVQEERTPSTQVVQMRVDQQKYESLSHAVSPTNVQVGDFLHSPPQLGELQQGKTRLQIENIGNEPTPFWVVNAPFTLGGHLLKLAPFLMGKHLLASQTFRDLFRSERVQQEEGIGIKDVTLLFTDLKGSTALYDKIGDAKAYFLVRQHFDILGEVINRHHGAVVKTIGDAVMATFLSPPAAVQAALEMNQKIQDFNATLQDQLILKIGIHRGHSIVVTLNERLDYFGQTVNIAARVQGLADAGEIYVSADVFRDPQVQQILQAATPHEVDVKGVSRTLEVYKLSKD